MGNSPAATPLEVNPTAPSTARPTAGKRTALPTVATTATPAVFTVKSCQQNSGCSIFNIASSAHNDALSPRMLNLNSAYCDHSSGYQRRTTHLKKSPFKLGPPPKPPILQFPTALLLSHPRQQLLPETRFAPWGLRDP